MSNSNTPAKPAAKAELFEVTLVKPHTHAGEPEPAGAKINVSGPERAFLESVGVINKAAEGATAPAEQ